MKHDRTDLLTEQEKKQRFQQDIWPEAPMLMRTALSMTTQTAPAEDLVQSTLLKAYKHLDRLEPGTNTRAWLMTLLRNTWIDQWRKDDRKPDAHAVDLTAAPEPEANTQDPAGVHDENWSNPEALMQRFGDQEIIDALRLIPEGYRWALLLVDVQSMSIPEAAEVLDIAPGTVKSRLHRGRAMLRDRLYDFANQRGWVTGPKAESSVEVKENPA